MLLKKKSTLKKQIDSFLKQNEGIKIEGVIANKVASQEQVEAIRKAVNGMGGPVFLGGVKVIKYPKSTVNDGDNIEDPVNPSLLLRNKVVACGKAVGEAINFEELDKISKKCFPVRVNKKILTGALRQQKIAVADDVAFHLTVQDNLDLIRREGGTVVTFSPITDIKLPKGVQALYLPHGYLHLYAADLERNKMLRSELLKFINDGGVVYAEGSATSYLCNEVILSDGVSYDMVGAINARATAIVSEEQWISPEYCSVVTLQDTVIAERDKLLRGYRELRWNFDILEEIQSGFEYVQSFEGHENEESLYGGLMPTPNIIASRMLFHWGIDLSIANRFVHWNS